MSVYVCLCELGCQRTISKPSHRNQIKSMSTNYEPKFYRIIDMIFKELIQILSKFVTVFLLVMYL